MNASGDLGLSASNINLFAVTDSKDQYSFVGGGGNSTEIRTHNEALTGTTLSAGGSLTLVSQQDIFSQGSTLNSGEGITLAAGGDIMLASAEAYNSSFKEVKTKSSGFFGSKKSTKTSTSESLTNLGTSLTSGGDIQLSAGADILLSGTKASAAGSIGLQAVGDIQLLSAVDQTSSQYQEQKKGSIKVSSKDQGSITQTAVTSELAGANISLTSGSNIALQGATLAANNTLSMGAANGTLQAVTQNADGNYVNALGEQVGNVTVGTQALQSSEWSKSSSGFRGILKDLVKIVAVGVAVGTGGLVHGEIKVGEADSTRTDSLTQQISTLAGNDLVIKAKDTIALIGAKISATALASLDANDITIDAAHEQTVVTTSHTEQTVSGKGATLQKDQISLASITETDQTERTTTTANTWQGSNISAGNLTLSANNNLAILASDISVDNNADIKAQNILVGGREATTETTHDSITKTKTLTVGVKNAYVDVALAAEALKDAKDAVSDAKNAYDDAKQKVAEGKLPASDLDFYKVNLAAATANLASATTAMYTSGAAAATAASTSMGTGFYISGGATTQTDTTSTTSSQGTWNGSNINVGGNTSLSSENNLNIEGSSINTAGQLALNANNINITAGKNTYTESSKSHSEGGGISVSMQPTTTSYSGSVNASQSRSDYQATDYVNSQIGAGSLVSNSDNLTIKGGNVSADKIDITTGGLTVESLQNTSSGSSTSAGFSVSASLGGSDKGWEGKNEDPTKSPAASGVTGFGGNASKGNSEKAWVAQQSGITGGTVNITAKDTTLTGAVIAAQNFQGEDNGQLTLTTGTLTVADIKDTDTSQNIGLGYSVSGLPTGETPPENTDPDAKDPMDPSQSTYSASFNGHDKQQTTNATIGLGNVTVGGTKIDEQSEFASLNRDASNSQEITKDVERGGLDMSLTVDNRMLSKAGWEDIANDVDETNTAVVNGVDYVADEIAVMGDNLPEELRGTLGQTGEDFVDGLIRQDLSKEEIEELLAKEKIRQGLAGAESANQALSGQTGQTDSQGSDAVSISSASTDAAMGDESGEVNLGAMTVTGSTEVTALQVGSAGLGKIQQELDDLRETNPEKAKVVETVIGLATGGPLKTAIGEAINQGIELASNASDTVANAMGAVAGYADDVLNWVGGIIEKDNAKNFALNVADERANPTEELGELGNSSVDVKDGVRLIATISGAGIGVGKKQTGTKEVASKHQDDVFTSQNGGPLPENYTHNTDGTITASGGGNAKPTGIYDIETKKEIYQRINPDGTKGGYYIIGDDGKQQVVKSPKPSANINDQREHHQGVVDETAANLEAQGNTVAKDGRVYNADGSGTYCKPDVCSTDSSGNATFYEIKTGDGQLTQKQREGFEVTSVDSNGNPTAYRIPPDATVSADLAEMLKIDSGGKIGDRFPDGIPVIITRAAGLND